VIQRTSSVRHALLTGIATIAIAATATSASAEEAAEQADTAQSERDSDEILVTGTLIRGIAPIGSNTQSLGADDLKRIGATSTNQILANIPVVTSQFNTTSATPSNVFLNVFRPNIRNLSSVGHNTTLVLVDGHNQVGVGTLQTSPDAGVIPAGALERVEVLADGGSALYGADAVGGIINFITRTRFDGVEASARYGFAKGGYEAYEANLTGGHSWSSGSVLVALSLRENSVLYASERSRPRQDLRPFGGSDFRSRACDPANVTAGGVTYALPDLAPNTINLCDTQLDENIVPEERLHSAFASLTQDISDNLRFDVKGLYSERLTTSRGAQLAGTNLLINASNPFFTPIGSEASQTVNFSFSPFAGRNAVSTSRIRQYQVTPRLTWYLSNDWVLLAQYNRGWSETDTSNPQVAPTIASYLSGPGLTTANAVNPYDLLATNPQVLSLLTSGYKQLGFATQTLNDVRVQADGALLSLPGGDVRAAIGAQWQRTTLDALAGVPATSLTDPLINTGSGSRNVSSLSGQVVVPVVGEDMEIPLVKSLKLDLSGRYDHYSDFGVTFNPRFAFTWEVGHGLQFRGNWGRSFNAPSLADTTGDAGHRAQYSANAAAIPPSASPTVEGRRPQIVVTGGNPDLQPQTAKTWSVGADFRPSVLPNLQLSTTYWNISMKDIIGMAPRNRDVFITPAYEPYFTINPTLAQVQALVGDLPLSGFPTSDLAGLYGNGVDPYILIDVRKYNFGTLKADGLDFRADYRQPFSWGSVFASVTGTRPLSREQQAAAGAPVIDQLAVNFSKLSVSSTLGVSIGNFSASATRNHSQGYTINHVAGQTRVEGFAPVNIALNYDFDSQSPIFRNLSVSLNVDNVGNINPPFINTSGGIANGSTLGRYVSVGVKKRI